MNSSIHIRTLVSLLLLGACPLDPKDLGDPTGATAQTSAGTDGATGEPSPPPEATTAPEATTTTGEGASTTGEDTSATTAVDPSATGEPDPIMCWGDPPSFPEFDRQCESDTDCALAFHQIECCGEEWVMGIAKTAVEQFDAAESICRDQYPACDCQVVSFQTEDGHVTDKTDHLIAICSGGSCKSWNIDPCIGVELPPCPAECAPGSNPDDCGQPCEVEGETCGNNIGDGMTCSGGVWQCTVHPPQTPGCNLVCQ